MWNEVSRAYWGKGNVPWITEVSEVWQRGGGTEAKVTVGCGGGGDVGEGEVSVTSKGWRNEVVEIVNGDDDKRVKTVIIRDVADL